MSDWVGLQKGRGAGGRIGPVISVREKGDIGILADAYEQMGEPTAIKLYHAEGKLGFEPTNRGDRNYANAYILAVQSNGKTATINPSTHTQALEIPPGRYEMHHDEDAGIYFIDYEGTEE